MLFMQKLIAQITEIEAKLNYVFTNKDLLILAFTHRSYANEHKEYNQHNERLEFLGDSVLGMLIAEFLYSTLPDMPEGELSAWRARLVQASSCSNYAQKLHLQDHLLLGKGERLNDGRGRETIISDLFEAILGAIYLDGGYKEAKKFFFDHFKDSIEDSLKSPTLNWKSLLQDLCQKKYQKEPTYSVLSISGPDHNKLFVVAVILDKKEIGKGEGTSIKMASQNAAKDAMQQLEGSHGR